MLASVLSTFRGGGAGSPSPAAAPQPGDASEAFAAVDRVLMGGATTSSAGAGGEDALRRLAEMYSFADQREDERLGEVFNHKPVMQLMHRVVASPHASHAMHVQAVQSAAIILQSVKGEMNLFTLLSQNHVNNLLLAVAPRVVVSPASPEKNEEEEDDDDHMLLTNHFVSLMKVLANRLDQRTIHFFFRGGDFPLLDCAVPLLSRPDAMLRSAARSIVLLILAAVNANASFTECRDYVTNAHAHFATLCSTVLMGYHNLVMTLSRAPPPATAVEPEAAAWKHWLGHVEMCLRDVQDDVAFLGDALALGPLTESSLCKAAEEEIVKPLVHDGTPPALVTLAQLARITNAKHGSALACSLVREVTMFFYPPPVLVQSHCCLLYLLLTNPAVSGNAQILGPALASRKVRAPPPPMHFQEEYPTQLVAHLLTLLESFLSSPRYAVGVRLCAKLIIMLAYEEGDEDTPCVSESTMTCVSNACARAAENVRQCMASSEGGEGFDRHEFVMLMEDEWNELKEKQLHVPDLLVMPQVVLPAPLLLGSDVSFDVKRFPVFVRAPVIKPWETARVAMYQFMVMRLLRSTLHRTGPDELLTVMDPVPGATTDVHPPPNPPPTLLRENQPVDVQATEYLTVKILGRGQDPRPLPAFLVVTDESLVLIEPRGEQQHPGAGVCRCVAPIHRVRVASDLADPSMLHVTITSKFAFGNGLVKPVPQDVVTALAKSGQGGFSATHSSSQWHVSLLFEGEAKALFAKDQIERASAQASATRARRMDELLTT